MKILILLPCVFLWMGCSKPKGQALTPCDREMIEKFKDQLHCINYPNNYTILQKGLYQKKTIYFFHIICATCDIMPITRGTQCDGTEVTITAFNEVTNIETVKACGK